MKKVISDNQKTNTLYIFPTLISKKSAIKTFQSKWNMNQSEFLTMEEWKELLFESNYPVLKEEKRNLSLYSCLSNDDKEFFKISSYFQFIPFARDFFNFWEEMNEEFISESDIIENISTDISVGDWQNDFFENLVRLKNKFNILLNEQKLSDQIFIRNRINLKIDNVRKFTQIVIINQFHFTVLEKYLVEKFDKQTILYLQLPEDDYDKKSFSLKKEAKLLNSENIKTQKIFVSKADEKLSMISGLFNFIDKYNCKNVVDFQFASQSYASFLSEEKFNLNKQKSLKNTIIYRFFYHIHNIISKIILYKDDIFLIHLQTVSEAMFSREFFEVFCEENIDLSQQEIIEFVQKLFQDNFQYIDLAGIFLKITKTSGNVKIIFYRFLEFVSNLIKIDNLTDFTELFKNCSELKFLNIFSEKELLFSNLQDVFFQAVSDFSTIEVVLNHRKWNEIFLPKKNQNKDLAISSGLFLLFLDYLKPKKFSLNHTESNEYKIRITDLQNSRNMTFDNIAILNLVEGILPATRKTRFFLTERQRTKLGLITYEKIELRDKYYFFRLIAQAETVHLFTMENIDQNIEVSSFLEELQILLPENLFELKDIELVSYSQIYSKFIDENKISLPFDQTLPTKEEFYAFPYHKDQDFPNNQIELSTYPWISILEDPFRYYLNDILKIRPKIIEIKADFSKKFIGIIIHELFKIIWNRLLEVYQGDLIHHNFNFTNSLYFDDALKHYLKTNAKFHYISPHNYSEVYFKRIFIPIVKVGITNFFAKLHYDFDFSDVYLKIIPEGEYKKGDSEDQRLLIKLDNEFEVYIRARADIRIEKGKQKLIIDYKSGKATTAKKKRYENQLYLYENFYYILQNPQEMDYVTSLLYFVEEKSFHNFDTKKITKDEIFSKFRDKFIENLEKIFEKGFFIATKKYSFEDTEISRRDLYRSQRNQEK
ncbi:MAG: PD-(D/E)XK nuclease family protein [Candidatus Cloacimonetes bacterium]|nr:PD-(D/E)XK nuclease family protein [Candidatus Cloacimonadota bacterium]